MMKDTNKKIVLTDADEENITLAARAIRLPPGKLLKGAYHYKGIGKINCAWNPMASCADVFRMLCELPEINMRPVIAAAQSITPVFNKRLFIRRAAIKAAADIQLVKELSEIEI